MKTIILSLLLLLLISSPTLAFSQDKSVRGGITLYKFKNEPVLVARRSGRSIKMRSNTLNSKKNLDKSKTNTQKKDSSKKGFFGGLFGGLLGGALLGSILGSAFGGGFGTVLMIIIVIGIAFILYKMYKSKREAKIEQLVKERMEKEKDFIHVDPKD